MHKWVPIGLRMDFALFQDFSRKLPRPAPPTDRPGPVQSDRTPEFGYEPLKKKKKKSLIILR